MSNNYSAPLPVDRNGNPKQQYPPPKTALQTTIGVPTASSVITFGPNTSEIEVGIIGNANQTSAVFKWGDASVVAIGATANFDHMISVPVGFRRLVIPRQSIGVRSVAGVNVEEGLYANCAVKIVSSLAQGSVWLTEY